MKNLNEDMPHFKKILEIIKKSENKIAYEWIDDAYNHVMEQKLDDENIDWGPVLQQNMAAIARADVVIIEATNMRFAQGYQAAMALQQKKPLLVLMRNINAKGKSVSGIADELMSIETYAGEDDLDKVVNKFIKDNHMTAKDMRFNFFIDRPIHNYLRWAAFKTGKTKAEVLRGLVQREIESKKEL
jgi:predicted house-cleaning noncanonical NTP pyrophosphatase (MazG superfamily)